MVKVIRTTNNPARPISIMRVDEIPFRLTEAEACQLLRDLESIVAAKAQPLSSVDEAIIREIIRDEIRAAFRNNAEISQIIRNELSRMIDARAGMFAHGVNYRG